MLVAEEMFESGCDLLISITSAKINPNLPPIQTVNGDFNFSRNNTWTVEVC
jgi:hypothetical protein